MKVLSLYRELLRECHRFPSYNYRQYALERVKYGFHQGERETDPKKIQELLKKAKDSLQLVRRQVTLGNLFSDSDRLVIENSSRAAQATKISH